MVLDISFLTDNELSDIGFADLGSNVFISRAAGILGASKISIGSNVRIDAFSLLSSSDGFIKIGNHVHIASYSSIIGRAGVVLGDYSGLSHGVRIFSASDDYSGGYLTNPTVPKEFTKVDLRKVEIGDHVIVGANTVILPGVNIGDGSAVGAQSLVTKSLDTWGIYSGVPARFIKKRSDELLKYDID